MYIVHYIVRPPLVDHEILLAKAFHRRIHGSSTALAWFELYLAHQKPSVSVDCFRVILDWWSPIGPGVGDRWYKCRCCPKGCLFETKHQQKSFYNCIIFLFLVNPAILPTKIQLSSNKSTMDLHMYRYTVHARICILILPSRRQ